ncbi:MAG: hypothetical protein HY903_19625 [Deltaproteobacteria bacterium]|nr:hypothetical protein [Deltaproteobacteria bacterium]
MAVWAALLFLPVVPKPHQADLVDPTTGTRTSVLVLFLNAFDVYINSFHSVITLPIP